MDDKDFYSSGAPPVPGPSYMHQPPPGYAYPPTSTSNTGKIILIVVAVVVVVLVVLGVLASIVMINFRSVYGRQDETKAKVDISNLDVAIEKYNIELGSYPPTLDDLVSNTVASPNWHGPYLRSGVPRDPWSHPYRYMNPGVHNVNGFDLWSDGDGKKPAIGLDNWTVHTK